jgi:hypothetical protein
MQREFIAAVHELIQRRPTIRLSVESLTCHCTTPGPIAFTADRLPAVASKPDRRASSDSSDGVTNPSVYARTSLPWCGRAALPSRPRRCNMIQDVGLLSHCCAGQFQPLKFADREGLSCQWLGVVTMHDRANTQRNSGYDHRPSLPPPMPRKTNRSCSQPRLHRALFPLIRPNTIARNENNLCWTFFPLSAVCCFLVFALCRRDS